MAVRRDTRPKVIAGASKAAAEVHNAFVQRHFVAKNTLDELKNLLEEVVPEAEALVERIRECLERCKTGNPKASRQGEKGR